MKLSSISKKAMFMVALSLLGLSTFAQTKTIFLGKADNINSTTVSIPLYVKNFTNVVSFQGSVNWDPTALTYAGITYSTTQPITTNASNVSLKDSTLGRVGFLWLDPNASGVSVPDSTIILTLKFNVSSSMTGTTYISFGSLPTSSEIDTIDQSTFIPAPTFDTAFIRGYVSKSVPVYIAISGPTMTATTIGATAPPIAYQWYSCTGICGPGVALSPIAGATSSTFNYNYKAGSYYVVVTYASGHKDTSTTVLPVKLISFKGKSIDKMNQLTWVSANEINFAQFIIERSTNAKDYYEIGTVKSQGKATEQAYSFNDAGINTEFSFYYRLKMVDNNGAYAYSAVVKLNKDGKSVFQILTNPIENGTIRVYGINMKEAKVYDNNGRLLLVKSLSNAQNAELKVNNLAKGFYLINIVSTDGLSQTEKFMVK